MTYNIFSYEYDLPIITSPSKKFLDIFEEINSKITSRGFVAKVAFVYEDGSYEISNITQCHSNLSSYPVRKSKLMYVLTFCGTPHRSTNAATHKKFIHWLVNESPYKEAFIIKDPEAIYKKYFVLNPYVPSNVMVGAAISTRFLHESHNEGGMVVWGQLEKLGLHSNHAFAFSHMFRPHSFTSPFPICYAPQDHHNVIHFSGSDKNLIHNFCNEKKMLINKSYLSEKRYSNIEALWGKNTRGDFGNKCKTLRPKVIKKHMSYNIFENAPRKSQKQDVFYLNNQEDLLNVFEQFREMVDKAA